MCIRDRRDIVTMRRDALATPMHDYNRILASRSWRFIMMLHRIKYRLTTMLSRAGLRGR